MSKHDSFDTGQEVRDRDFDGPFLFCDYWASVLNLRDIVNPEALDRSGPSLELFRKILNRPTAALPKLGYFIIASLMKPFTVSFRGLLRLARGRKKARQAAYDRDTMRNLLLQHSLKVTPTQAGLADVYSDGECVASDVVNPLRIRGSSSMFFARYKVFLASLVALGYGVLIGPVFSLLGAESVIVPYLGVLSYPIVLLILWFMFDDLLTAAVAPLPLIALRMIVRIGQGFEGFVIAMVGTACVLYLVEWFFVPRSLPPAVYLYINDDQDRRFPYKSGHEPYWLEGRYYWVWRYVTLAPAELIKFWEKDWERLEIWIRADGERRGRIEWLVTDWHYRELWFRYEALTGKRAQQIHDTVLKRYLATDQILTWVAEIDMDLVFHSPAVKGVYFAVGKRLSFGRRVASILSVIFRKRAMEDPEKHKRSLELLEIQGSEFLEDVPEHFRITAIRRLLSLPWSYWRFPRGVRCRKSFFVYGSSGTMTAEPEGASDRRFQIKEPG